MFPSAAGGTPAVVIDTNRVLDLWLFDDPQVDALRDAIACGGTRWLAQPAMREELARVLGYPAVLAQLARRQRTADMRAGGVRPLEPPGAGGRSGASALPRPGRPDLHRPGRGLARAAVQQGPRGAGAGAPAGAAGRDGGALTRARRLDRPAAGLAAQ
ncbi:MAG: PIN domain-containing protein [Ottowia sp.]